MADPKAGVSHFLSQKHMEFIGPTGDCMWWNIRADLTWHDFSDHRKSLSEETKIVCDRKLKNCHKAKPHPPVDRCGL